MPLDNIKNLALKNLGIKMVEGGLGESAIRGYTNVVKMVVLRRAMKRASSYTPGSGITLSLTSHESVTQNNHLSRAS
jgi:hypothetical protein